jgi:predicted RNA binding protein YcfA (HicA-like mRNA interferase family)
MTRLPALKPKQVLRALQRAGFFIHHTTGSHYALRHQEMANLKVTLPYHTGDLKRKVLKSIIKQAGLTDEKFLELL